LLDSLLQEKQDVFPAVFALNPPTTATLLSP